MPDRHLPGYAALAIDPGLAGYLSLHCSWIYTSDLDCTLLRFTALVSRGARLSAYYVSLLSN